MTRETLKDAGMIVLIITMFFAAARMLAIVWLEDAANIASIIGLFVFTFVGCVLVHVQSERRF